MPRGDNIDSSDQDEIRLLSPSSSRASRLNVWSDPSVAVADRKQRELMQTIRSWAEISGAYVILGRIIPSCSFQGYRYEGTKKFGAGEPEID
jgi:hypothetical protein